MATSPRQTDTAVQRDWGYKGSFRTYIGYQWCDCCEEIRFTYWNYSNSTHQLSPPASETNRTTQFTGQLEINALNPGDRLLANNQLLMNTYDIDYSKCICYGDCDPCNPCCCCPPWGLKYYVGIRIADVQRGDNSQVTDSEDSIAAQSFINTKFTGAGPRVGLEGRRWFGCDQMLVAVCSQQLRPDFGPVRYRRARTSIRNPPPAPLCISRITTATTA